MQSLVPEEGAECRHRPDNDYHWTHHSHQLNRQHLRRIVTNHVLSHPSFCLLHRLPDDKMSVYECRLSHIFQLYNNLLSKWWISNYLSPSIISGYTPMIWRQMLFEVNDNLFSSTIIFSPTVIFITPTITFRQTIIRKSPITIFAGVQISLVFNHF